MRCPVGAEVRADRQGSELVEGEDPVREAGGDLLDAGKFGLRVRVVGLLPRLGALEGDVVLVQELP